MGQEHLQSRKRRWDRKWARLESLKASMSITSDPLPPARPHLLKVLDPPNTPIFWRPSIQTQKPMGNNSHSNYRSGFNKLTW